MRSLTARSFRLTMLLLAGVALLSVGVGLAVGAERGLVLSALGGDPTARFIFLRLRLPRVLAGLFVGGALAACGAAFQALMRNSLASPYVLGISGGGSLGAVLAILLGAPALALGGATISTRPVFAFAGCLLALLLIYAIARRRGRLAPRTLLLAGVVVNAFFLAVLGYLNYLSTPHQSQEILRWMMGGLYGQTPGGVTVSGFLAVIGLLGLAMEGRALNVLSLGEESATQLGISVRRVRRRIFVLASVMTGAAVAVSGPIGFVGLFVPHGVRLLTGPDHRLLLPASFLAGGAFLTLADALGRMIAGPGEMPVGLITAAVGAPCFILLLIGGRGYAGEGA